MSEIQNGEAKYWAYPTKNYTYDQEIRDFLDKYIIPYLKSKRVGNIEAYATIILMNGITTYWANTPDGIMEIYLRFDGDRQKISKGIGGKDYFIFQFNKTNGNVEPWGGIESSHPRDYYMNSTEFACASQTNRLHVFCAKVIMMDGWEIKDDYPWF